GAVQCDQPGDAGRAAGSARRDRTGRLGARGRAGRRRSRVFAGPRPEGNAGELDRGVHRRPVQELLRSDAELASPAAAGDRQSTWHRAGCQLVAAADMAVAAADARFATSGIDFGLFCATPGVPVSRNIAVKRAFEMVMTGEFIDAPTALAWGLVNRVAPPADLDAEVAALAKVLMGKPRRVLAAGKEFFYRQLEQNLVAAYADASEVITQNMLGQDAQEGVAAFVGKRKPRWDDRSGGS